MASRPCGWIRLVVTIGAGCSTGAERSEDREAQLRMKATCAEAGQKARRDWVAQYPSETFSNSPEFAYNGRLNTCLYYDEYTDTGTGASIPHALMNTKTRRDRFVLDVYANKVLLEYTEHDGRPITANPDPIMCRTEAEFNTKKAGLFSGGNAAAPGKAPQ